MAEFHVGLTVNPKAEPYIVWLEKNRPNLQLAWIFSARDPRPHIVLTVDATDTTDAGEQAAKVERAVDITAPVGPPVGRERGFQVALLLEQDAEVRGGLWIAGRVGPQVGLELRLDVLRRQYVLEARALLR